MQTNGQRWCVGSFETEQGLDLGPLTLTMKSSFPWPLKPYALCISSRDAEARCLPKEGLNFKDWWILDLTSLHQGGPQGWPFTHFFFILIPKNYAQGWRFNMLMRHLSTVPVGPTSCISFCPFMLRCHSFPVLASLKTVPGLCSESRVGRALSFVLPSLWIEYNPQ